MRWPCVAVRRRPSRSRAAGISVPCPPGSSADRQRSRRRSGQYCFATLCSAIRACTAARSSVWPGRSTNEGAGAFAQSRIRITHDLNTRSLNGSLENRRRPTAVRSRALPSKCFAWTDLRRPVGEKGLLKVRGGADVPRLLHSARTWSRSTPKGGSTPADMAYMTTKGYIP